MLSPIPFDASDEILHALAAVGRTEDIAFSPDNRRIAVAGFTKNCIAIIDIELRFEPEPTARLTGLTELRSDGLARPHGLEFLDDHLLAVANRSGGVMILPVPPPVDGVARTTVEPVMVIGSDDTPVASPGSLTVEQHGPGLFELLVCNNYVHHVTRHMVDSRALRVVSAEVLLSEGLSIPDGIAISNDHRWLAVSNHRTHSALIFENTADLGPNTPAVGELHDVTYPHGMRFTADDSHLIVADGGAPHVVVFERGEHDWRGHRTPTATIRVMDDHTFRLGNTNPQEGGPKGLDIDSTGRIVAMTAEHVPLQLLVLTAAPALRAAEANSTATVEAMRSTLIRALDRPRALEQRANQLERELAGQRKRIEQLERVVKRTRATVFEQQKLLEQAQLGATETGASGRRDTVGS